MEKIPMRARQAFTYAGKKLVPGSAFNAAGQSDRRLLAAIGRAEDAPEPAKPAAAVQKVMKADEKVVAKPRGYAPGTYKRRDMVAQVPAEPAVAPAAPASAPVAAPAAAPAAEPKPAASTDVGAVTTHDYR